MTRRPGTYGIVVVALLAGVLTSCGTETEPTPSPATQPAPAAAQAPPPSPTTQPAPTAAQTATPTPVPPAPTATPPQAPATEAGDGPVESSISDFRLRKHTIEVGTTIEWTNDGDAQHTATSGTPGDPDDIWDSGTIRAGKTYSFTSMEPGTYNYFCKFHPTLMTATITVTGTAPAAAVQPADTPTATPTPVPPTATPTATQAPPTATASATLETPTATATQELPTATPTAEPIPEPVTVLIQNFRHENLSIPVGTTVTWIQKDPTTHTTTSGTPSVPSDVWDSGFLDQNEEFPFTFTEPGVYEYFCEIHTSMLGIVTVGESGTSTPGATTGDEVASDGDGTTYDY